MIIQTSPCEKVLILSLPVLVLVTAYSFLGQNHVGKWFNQLTSKQIILQPQILTGSGITDLTQYTEPPSTEFTSFIDKSQFVQYTPTISAGDGNIKIEFTDENMITAFYLLSDKVIYNYRQNFGLNTKTVIYDLKTRAVRLYNNCWVVSVSKKKAQIQLEYYDNKHSPSDPEYKGRIIVAGEIDLRTGEQKISH